MGVLLALLGALAFSLMNVFVRNGVRMSDGDTGILTTMLINVAIYAVLVTAALAAGGFGPLDPAGVGWFVLAGLAATFVGRHALFGAISHIGAARGAAIKNATPLVAVGLAVFVLGEQLTAVAVFGIALIIVALVLLIAESVTRSDGDATDDRALAVAEALESEAVAETGWWDRTRTAADRTVAAIRSPARHVLVFGVVLGVLAAFAFGTGHVFRKLGMDILPNALVGAAIGSTTALTAYLLTSAVRGRAGGELRSSFTSRRPWIWGAGVAGTGGQVSFFAALAFAPVSYVSAVSGSETILTVMCAAALARRPEAITMRVIVPAILMLAGTALIGLGG
jgi:drug/metabolite transporter (DMT)-like permease